MRYAITTFLYCSLFPARMVLWLILQLDFQSSAVSYSTTELSRIKKVGADNGCTGAIEDAVLTVAMTILLVFSSVGMLCDMLSCCNDSLINLSGLVIFCDVLPVAMKISLVLSGVLMCFNIYSVGIVEISTDNAVYPDAMSSQGYWWIWFA